jgi:hypothetical protein
LAEVAAEFDNRDAAIDRSDFAQHGERMIAGAVVDQDDFETLARRFHHRFEAVIEVGDVFLLVM